MPRPLPVDYLQPDEAIRQEADRHPASLLDEWLGAIVVAAVAIGAIAFATLTWQPEWFALWAWIAMAAILLALAGFMLARYWRMRTSHYVVTDERVYKAYGRIRFFLLQTTYDKVTDLHIHQSVWGRMGDFGTIRVETAGTGVVLEGVRAPLQFKRGIETAREAFIRKLIGQHVPTAEVEAPVDELLWRGGPVGASMLGGFVSAGGVALYAMLASAGALVFDGLAAWIPIAAWALATIIALRTWIRFRYTRYEVHARGVVFTAGWLSRRRVETRYEKVTDVTTYQGILGRVLGFGAITINTAGSNQAPVVFSGVADPEAVKRIIDGARGA